MGRSRAGVVSARLALADTPLASVILICLKPDFRSPRVLANLDGSPKGRRGVAIGPEWREEKQPGLKTSRRSVPPLEFKQVFGNGPAVVSCAETVRLRQARHMSKKNLFTSCSPASVMNDPTLNAGQVHVEQDERDASGGFPFEALRTETNMRLAWAHVFSRSWCR